MSYLPSIKRWGHYRSRRSIIGSLLPWVGTKSARQLVLVRVRSSLAPCSSDFHCRSRASRMGGETDGQTYEFCVRGLPARHWNINPRPGRQPRLAKVSHVGDGFAGRTLLRLWRSASTDSDGEAWHLLAGSGVDTLGEAPSQLPRRPRSEAARARRGNLAQRAKARCRYLLAWISMERN